MSGVTDLARHIKARDNPSSYTPMFGRIISLPKLVIQLGNNILLDDSDIKSVFDIYETQERDNHTEYKYLGKEEAEGREIIRDAKIKADAQAREIIEDANKQATEILNKAEKNIEREKQKAMEEMRKEVAALAMLAAERIVEREIQNIGQDEIVDEVINKARSTGWQN